MVCVTDPIVIAHVFAYTLTMSVCAHMQRSIVAKPVDALFNALL